jgi:hypothetical protein
MGELCARCWFSLGAALILPLDHKTCRTNLKPNRFRAANQALDVEMQGVISAYEINVVEWKNKECMRFHATDTIDAFRDGEIKAKIAHTYTANMNPPKTRDPGCAEVEARPF